jgi:hypothetical protein
MISVNRTHLMIVMALIALNCWGQTPTVRTVENLVRTVRSGLQMHQSDEQLALAIDAIRLAENLSDDVIEQLETEGAGRLAVNALERQRDASIRLPGLAKPLTLFKSPAAPSAEEQSRVIEQARTWAAQYITNLPDFLCMREVSQYTKRKDSAPWQKEEVLTWEVGYAERKDYQRLVLINGQPAQKKKLRGLMSMGEFGSSMWGLFQPEQETKFQWSRWSNLHGRPTYVFSYYLDQKHSGIALGHPSKNRGILIAIRGSVYIDGETNRIMRIINVADGIPDGFPIRGSYMALDYDYNNIGAEKFLLPVRSILRTFSKDEIACNVSNFTNYRKFTSEVKIEFKNP